VLKNGLRRAKGKDDNREIRFSGKKQEQCSRKASVKPWDREDIEEAETKITSGEGERQKQTPDMEKPRWNFALDKETYSQRKPRQVNPGGGKNHVSR